MLRAAVGRWASVALTVTGLVVGVACAAGKTDESTSEAAAGGSGGSGGFGNGGNGNGDGGIAENPCGSECGNVEQCDGVHSGRDDDCDGEVDEGCNCNSGVAQDCFKGDASYLGDPGCFPGTQKCTELGQWGPCVGGVHATDNCFSGSVISCHPISSVPFVVVDLSKGLGTFGDNAVLETFSVACPSGVSPCPIPTASEFQPLQSGEYTVTYQKTLANNATEECEFPLFVGAPGLRVELTWDWDASLGSNTVDLDLHLHEPQNTEPWGGTNGNLHDCAWGNCTAKAFDPAQPDAEAPEWFTGIAPPDPVSWWLSPVAEENTCYFGPKGNGEDWQGIGLGCHNPRLDIDNISCDPNITDSANAEFCNPENINIDYPPTDGWIRIAVNYWSNHGQTYDVHPLIKVFCDGALSAELGPLGYNNQVTFAPDDGLGNGSGSSLFWVAADVLFLPENECGTGAACVVKPLYDNTSAKTPFTTTASTARQTFPGPAYPAIPEP